MTPIPIWFPLATFAVLVAASVYWISVSDESFRGSPGRQGDDVYFENIAYHLAQDDGVYFDFTDENWQKPYRDANQAGENDWIIHLQVRGATTSRSPGFPILAAGVYQVWGRDWIAVRVVMIVLLSAALTLLVVVASRRFGMWVGSLAVATLALDFFVLRTAGQFMSEGLGAVLICVLFSVLMPLTNPMQRLAPGTRLWGWFFVGLIYGAGILVRANLNAWLMLAAALLVGLVALQVIRRRPFEWLVVPSLVFGLGVVVVVGPWWYRNCVVTQAFSPMGTSGSFGLAGGYSDAAYAQWGNWDPQAVDVAQAATLSRPGILSRPLAEQEYEMGRESTRMARQWIANNPQKVPLLMLRKAVSHFGFYRQPVFLMGINGLLCGGAILGCFYARHSWGLWTALIVGLSLIATVLTWEHYGRYSIPIRPLIHASCAIGAVEFWRRVFQWHRHRAAREMPKLT